MAKLEATLSNEIKRTDLLEENVALLREDFAPVKGHVDFVNRACKFFTGGVAAVGGILGIIYTIARFTGHL